jgi:aminoglycoside 3-N-acetyltransferase
MHTRATLSADLRALGVVAGDVVMAHASVRAIGEIAGGPDEIHLAIKDVIGADGTLFMYAGCPQYVDEVGRGNLSAGEEAEVLEKLPAFDAETARCDRSHGALVELFRTYPGTRVNDHVARFAAWGAHAAHLLSPTPWDFAYGRGSIFERFVALDGKVLLLGSDHDNVTFLHHAEHVVDLPDKRVATFKVAVMESGVRVWREMSEYDTSEGGAHASWPENFFARIIDDYLAATSNRGGTVGNATSYLIDARGLLESALSTMTRVASAH